MTTWRQPARRWAAALALVALLMAALPVRAQDGPPSAARLNGVRHVYQEWNNCGPANLTMALSYFGWGYGQNVAANWLKPNPEDKNVSPGQMVNFVNYQANTEVRALWRYGGDLELIKRAIASGFPIIIESGYDVEDLGWMGHYETVVAYDDNVEGGTFWVYDSYLGIGSGYGRVHQYEELDSWWRHFNRTYILLFPLDREAEVRALLGDFVDPVVAAQSALDRARQEAAVNPTDAWAWFNAGTSATWLGRYHDAAIYYDEAFRQGLPYRVTWYMFGPYEAYWNVGRFQDVLTLAENTEKTTEYVEETYYWRGMASAALGDLATAHASFQQAIALNHNFDKAVTANTELDNGTFRAPAPA